MDPPGKRRAAGRVDGDGSVAFHPGNPGVCCFLRFYRTGAKHRSGSMPAAPLRVDPESASPFSPGGSRDGDSLDRCRTLPGAFDCPSTHTNPGDPAPAAATNLAVDPNLLPTAV